MSKIDKPFHPNQAEFFFRNWSPSARMYLAHSKFDNAQMDDARSLGKALHTLLYAGLLMTQPHEQMAFDELLAHYAKLRNLPLLEALADLIISNREDHRENISKQKLSELGWLLRWGIPEYKLGLWALRQINRWLESSSATKSTTSLLLFHLAPWVGGIKSTKEVKEYLDQEDALLLCEGQIWHLTPAATWSKILRKPCKILVLNPDGNMGELTESSFQDHANSFELELARGAGNSNRNYLDVGQKRELLPNIWHSMSHILSEFPTVNFQAPENGFVWTAKPVAVVKFHVDLKSSLAVLAMGINAHAHNVGSELAVYLNGILLYSSTIASTGERTVKLVLRDGQLAPGAPNELVFFTDKIARQSKDGREVGVMVTGMGIFDMGSHL